MEKWTKKQIANIEQYYTTDSDLALSLLTKQDYKSQFGRKNRTSSNVHTSKKAAKMSKKEANRYYEQTFKW